MVFARVLPLLTTAAIAATCGAQERRDPAEQLAAKLASPFLKKAPWVLDWDEARALAKKRGQLIFGYFTTAGP